LIMRFFSVVKLFTQDFVFVWKILLACGFNASGHTQVENVFRIRAGFATIIPIFVWSAHADFDQRFMVGSCRFDHSSWSDHADFDHRGGTVTHDDAPCAQAKEESSCSANFAGPVTQHCTALDILESGVKHRACQIYFMTCSSTRYILFQNK
jgi:hypothetical protein